MIEIIPNWHPIFVHFTVGLLTIAALLHVLTLLISNPELKSQLQTTGRWNLWIGALISIFTVLAGWFAYNSVNHDTPSHLVMTQHRNIALVTLAVFVALAAWSWIGSRKGQAITGLFTVLLLVATGVLATTAWYGGEIVYRYGLGVMSLPNPDKHSHASGDQHDHGSAGGHDAEGHAHDGETTGHDDLSMEDSHTQDNAHSHAEDQKNGDQHSHDALATEPSDTTPSESNKQEKHEHDHADHEH